MRRLLLIVGGVLLLAAALVLVPSLLRRDAVHYRWVGAIGADVLEEPIGIAVLGPRLYVTDAARNAVAVFDTAGSLVAEWPGEPLGLSRPMHLAVGRDDLFYISDYLGDRIVVVDTAGTRVRTVGGRSGSGAGELDAPGGVGVLKGTLFVADFYNHRVQVFGAPGLSAVGRPGRLLPGRLHYPTDVAVSDSLLYVADAYNHRIQVFRVDGTYVCGWGGPLGFGVPGPFKGWFRVATGVEAVRGRVYVADFYNDRIQVFDTRGRYLAQLRDSLKLPTDVAVSDNGDLFVADFGNGWVDWFRRAP